MNPEEIHQPDHDVEFYQRGVRSRNIMSVREAQEMLDSELERGRLTSDQYDSFWLGWHESATKIVPLY